MELLSPTNVLVKPSSGTMNALSALGLAYYDSDDDEDADGDEGNATPTPSDVKETVIEGTAALPTPTSHSSQAVLPDYSTLLSDLPDKVDWNARRGQRCTTSVRSQGHSLQLCPAAQVDGSGAIFIQCHDWWHDW